MISVIDHVNIVVTDLERSVAFYTELLGFEVVKRVHMEGDWIEAIVGLKGVLANVVYVRPPGGEPRLELVQYHAPAGSEFADNAIPNTTGLRHLAFNVDDMDAMYERLKADGVTFFGPPVIVPLSVVTHNSGHKKLCYFYDPDGVVLELSEYV
jgi:catechol 2,3-dioxygenase-like lactoylglutathione lyase family enzyme